VVPDDNQDDAAALDYSQVGVVVLDDNPDDAAALDCNQVCVVVLVDDYVSHHHE
jgi:hypothetical protein